MPIHNSDIAQNLKQIADLLEIKGANRFRVRAYNTAARNIETATENIRDLVDQEVDLTELPGIGKDIAEKIHQLIKIGKIPALEELKQELPAGLLEMLDVEGLGPKRVKRLYEELDITNLAELQAAAQEERIRRLDGFGEKIEQKILQNIKNKSAQEKRMLLYRALEIVEPLKKYLQKIKSVSEVEVAGSYRRKKETVGDLDIIVASEQGEKVIKKFVHYEDVTRVISQGETRSSVVLRGGLQVDLRVVEAESFGAALQYFTGNKQHNIQLRQLAIKQNCKLNEYGLFEKKGKQEKAIAGASEPEIYQKLGLDFIEPELRQGQREIKAAQEKKLPHLVTVQDVKGDLQMHSQASDGAATLKAMALTCKELGYEYMAITDHSQNLKVAHGLDAKRYHEQFKKIAKLNNEIADFVILKSAEVDILKDGSLDLDEKILQEFDLVVCSIHSHFNLPEKEQTQRIIKAMQSPFFHIWGHPTGRLINSRDPYKFDWDQVLQAAKEKNCILEINAQPNRLDLDTWHARQAKEVGVKLSLGTDAHQPQGLHFMQLGVDQARRAWLEPADIVNCLPLKELKQLLQKD